MANKKGDFPTSMKAFANRGDPWITDRERGKLFPVMPYENADLDRFTRAQQAAREKRRSVGGIPITPAKTDTRVADERRAGVNRRIKLNRLINNEERGNYVKRAVAERRKTVPNDTDGEAG